MMKRASEGQTSDSQITVFVRMRPLRNELQKRSLKVIDKGVALNYKDKIYQLYFDGVLDEAVGQQQVFESTCLPMVKDVLAGSNSALFVYGQTGTGKTYTMGTLESIKREDQGLIPLTLNHLLQQLGESKSHDEWSISLSFMQIYMEDIFDLLNPSSGKLQIREDLEYGETYVEDLVIVPISTYEQSIELINAGLKFRKIGNQRMNQLSSRSHTIFTIYVSQRVSPTEYMSSTFSLIDLAGSERVKKSNSADTRLQEAKFINTSLSALGNVISALSANRVDKFVPYRSSKLTRILKNSLSGRSKVSVICTLDIAQENTYETYSTLLFADRCKEIRFPNQPVINMETFEDLNQDKELRQALDRSLQKEKEYVQVIKGLEGGSRISRDSQRENQLAQIIETIYKLFGEINEHLGTVLNPAVKHVKPEIPRVTPSSTGPSIKSNIKQMAEETIEGINALSALAVGEAKNSATSRASKLETETLCSLLSDSLRQNLKLYQRMLIKEEKDSLEKDIYLKEYEKERRQEVLDKLKAKKLKSLQNHFEEIWTEPKSTFNPLQSLLNSIRRSETGIYAEKVSPQPADSQDLSNPKEFLKMLTRQEEQRKNKEMLIEEGDEDRRTESPKTSGKSSGIQYFQRTSPTVKEKEGESKVKENSSNEIKKLLDSLIANKTQFEQLKKAP